MKKIKKMTHITLPLKTSASGRTVGTARRFARSRVRLEGSPSRLLFFDAYIYASVFIQSGTSPHVWISANSITRGTARLNKHVCGYSMHFHGVNNYSARLRASGSFLSSDGSAISGETFRQTTWPYIAIQLTVSCLPAVAPPVPPQSHTGSVSIGFPRGARPSHRINWCV